GATGNNAIAFRQQSAFLEPRLAVRGSLAHASAGLRIVVDTARPTSFVSTAAPVPPFARQAKPAPQAPAEPPITRLRLPRVVPSPDWRESRHVPRGSGSEAFCLLPSPTTLRGIPGRHRVKACRVGVHPQSSTCR